MKEEKALRIPFALRLSNFCLSGRTPVAAWIAAFRAATSSSSPRLSTVYSLPLHLTTIGAAALIVRASFPDFPPAETCTAQQTKQAAVVSWWRGAWRAPPAASQSQRRAHSAKRRTALYTRYLLANCKYLHYLLRITRAAVHDGLRPDFGAARATPVRPPPVQIGAAWQVPTDRWTCQGHHLAILCTRW